MQYRKDKSGNELSMLGYGCMRFTRNGREIDLPKAEEEIMAAYRAGVNYYDTAYIYQGSEAALGTILERNGIRGQVNIATKLPQYMIGSSAALDRYFSEELSRLKTTYVDYYLMHHLTDPGQWQRLKGLGILEWIAEKKRTGAIRNIGFSYHGNTENFLSILEDYPWDFCQIQYNYLDETSQAGVRGLKRAAELGIPVVIMEPLRGGKLVSMLPEKAKRMFLDNPKGWTPAEWAFRWLYNQPEVTVVLSGMNSLEMVEENARVASDAAAGAFSQEDLAFLSGIRDIIREGEKVGCTGCRYCMPCPKGVDIPGIFRCWNLMSTESKSSGRFEFAQTVGLTRAPPLQRNVWDAGNAKATAPRKSPSGKS